MRPIWIRLHREERGVAMIVALMVSFVVLLLSIYVLNQAVHNQQQAAQDRGRLTAQGGAEAGLNYWYNVIQNTDASHLPLTAHTGAVISGPNSVDYTATPTYYSDAGGTVPFVGALSDTNYPKSVRIVSVGTAGDGADRAMQSFLVLHPIFGGFDGALIANNNVTLTNSFTVNGNLGNDGDLLILNGNFNATSGLGVIKGNVYVSTPGHTLTITTNLHVYGSVWATGNVSINHIQALVDTDAKSSSGGVTVTNGLVSGKAYYCTGAAPTHVTGAKISTCALGDPPSTTFPQVTFDQTAWESSGYWVKTLTGATACTDARKYIESDATSTVGKLSTDGPLHTGGIVVRIASNCTYVNTNNVTVTLPTNLAVVTDGGINLNQRSTWNGVSGTKSLYFLHAWPSVGTYACVAANGAYDLGDVALGNLTSFDSHVQTSVYSPCEAVMMNNNSSFTGQVIGSSMLIGNNFNMTYRPVLIPGARVTGFKEDIAYIREISH